MIWSQWEDTLRDCAARGMTMKEASAIIPTSRSAICAKAQRLGISFSGSLKASKTAIKAAEAKIQETPKRGVTLVDLTGCKWVTHAAGADSAFCNDRREDSRPYCARHAIRAYQA